MERPAYLFEYMLKIIVDDFIAYLAASVQRCLPGPVKLGVFRFIGV